MHSGKGAVAMDSIVPVGIGRVRQGRYGGPEGTWYLGPDPADRNFFSPHRSLPAYHRGAAYLRLLRVPLARRAGPASYRQALLQPLAIHGPVTPSLIWGDVSAGCIRLRPKDLRSVYAFALRHPSAPVYFHRQPQPLDRGKGDSPAFCSERGPGIRRLQRLPLGHPHHDRSCGVDHWYSISIQGGDRIAISLRHRGSLRVELFGIRAISAIAGGTHGFAHRLPFARNSQGPRYLRVTGDFIRSGLVPYTLLAERLR